MEKGNSIKNKFLITTKKYTKRFINCVKSRDRFGEPIMLNYKGQKTFNTFPGGLISISMMSILTFYFCLKFAQMLLREEWSLVQ